MSVLYKAIKNGDEGVFKCKNIGETCPLGYEKVNSYFVDNSGFGTDGEMALTAGRFLAQVKEGLYYGITSIGQFQVYIAEFKKIAKSRKDIYKNAGITSSKLVKRNTRLTEYIDGRRVLRLHNTDIITWTADGKIILNTGGWHTHTTKARLNEFLPDYIRVYQKNLSWYIIKNNDYTNKIEFKDGIQFQA